MSLNKIVAENLHTSRLQQKLTQEDVAQAAGMSVSYISMLERGERSPPLETLDALAKALRVSPFELLQAGGSKRRQRRGG
jgi:transcriptional regulator with XRE-family HTH domain